MNPPHSLTHASDGSHPGEGNGLGLSKANVKASRKSARGKGDAAGNWVLNPNARCLDIDKAGIYLGVSRRAVWRLVARGTLRAIRLPGLRKVLIDRLELERVIEEGKQ